MIFLFAWPGSEEPGQREAKSNFPLQMFISTSLMEQAHVTNIKNASTFLTKFILNIYQDMKHKLTGQSNLLGQNQILLGFKSHLRRANN